MARRAARRWGMYRRDDNTWAVRAGDTDLASGITDRAAAATELTRLWQADGQEDAIPGEVPFTIPLLIAEGVETGDGRIVEPGGLVWRELPLPLMLLTETGWGHDGAVIAGRIDEVHRVGAAAGVPGGIAGSGAYLDTDDGRLGAQLAETQAVRGISADVDDIEVTLEDVPGAEPDEDGWLPMRERLVSGRVMGGTQCPFPAFQECSIEVQRPAVDDAQDPTIVVPDAAAAASSGESFSDCGPCQQEAQQQAALASRPLRWAMTTEDGRERPRRRGPVTAAGRGAGTGVFAGLALPPAEWFTDPGFTDEDTHPIEGYPGVRGAPLTITADGRVFGHAALFGVCHTGYQDQCVTVPRDPTGDYSYFRTGSAVTAGGQRIATGALTVGTGHAGLELDWRAAASHYDDTGAAVADVVTGEDQYGVWVAGSIRPGTSPEQVYALQASGLSGDWRWVGNATRMVAVLGVNVPGFPVARPLVASSMPDGLLRRARVREGRVMALTAAGAAPLAQLHADPYAARMATLEAEVATLRAAISPLMPAAFDALTASLEPANR